MRVGLVCLIYFASHPAAVVFTVTSIVVYPVDGMECGGPWSHVSVKIGKLLPVVGDLDAAHSVALVLWTVYSSAALLHPGPHAVFARCSETMFFVWV